MKSLDDIPEPVEHSEQRRVSVVTVFREVRKAKSGGWWVFAEAKAVNRDEKIKYLAECKYADESLLKGLPDEAIDQLHKHAMGEDEDMADASPGELATKPEYEPAAGGASKGLLDMDDRESRPESTPAAAGPDKPLEEMGQTGQADISDLTAGKPPEEMAQDSQQKAMWARVEADGTRGYAPGKHAEGDGQEPGPGHEQGGDYPPQPGGDSADPGAHGQFDMPPKLTFDEYQSMAPKHQRAMWDRMMGHMAEDEKKPEEMSEDERRDMAHKYAAMYRKYAHFQKNDDASSSADTSTSTDDHDEGSPVSTSKQASTSKSTSSNYAEAIAREVGRQVGIAMADMKKHVYGRVDKLDKFAERRIAAEKRATVDVRMRELVKAGKVLPAQVPTLTAVAMAMDATTLRKFSEKDEKGRAKVAERTPFDQFFRETEDWPQVASFSERVKPGRTSKAGDSDEDAQIEEIKGHFENFAEKFPKTVTAEALVDGFKAERKHKRDLTAKEFLQIA